MSLREGGFFTHKFLDLRPVVCTDSTSIFIVNYYASNGSNFIACIVMYICFLPLQAKTTSQDGVPIIQEVSFFFKVSTSFRLFYLCMILGPL